MNCDEIRDRLEEFALGQLPDAERERVAAHIAECPACRAELDELETMLHGLANAIVDAGAARRPDDEVLAELHHRIQAREPASAAQAGPSALRRMRRWWSPYRMAAAALVLALAVSVGWGLRLNQALSEERELRERIGELVDQQEIVLEIVDGADTERRLLRPPAGVDSDSYGKVFTRPDFDEAVIMTGRLPSAPVGDAYHVWLATEGEPRLAGILAVNEDGFGLLVIETGVAGPAYQSALVTLQPEGATAPGGQTVLSWSS